MNSTQNSQIWKALADPTRRQLLDQIRQAPRTTGQLVDTLGMGRCAVMKHLGILEKARLISIKREGKYRWNYINVIPLQEIYERWVKKYEVQWASNLLQLKELSEHTLETKNIMESPTITINLTIAINAPLDHVWKCLLHEVNRWWRQDFYTSERTRQFIIEPKVGGRMYEDYGNDNGLLWAEVIVLDAPNILELKGHLTPEFGGPAISFLKLALKEDGQLTTLTLTDTVFGVVDDKNKKSLESGWKLLFEDSFKEYAETEKKFIT